MTDKPDPEEFFNQNEENSVPDGDQKPKESYFTWSGEDHTDAFSEYTKSISSFDGIRSSTASSRSYIDIEPNISVRSEFRYDDYYRFRPGEDPTGGIQHSMYKCMKAYDKVGIIKNVIDLMGDFGSQGITIHHKSEKVQQFYRTWWKKVGGVERSERFLNMLYRCGNVFIYKRYGKITRKMQRDMSKAIEEVDIPMTKVEKRKIPVIYNFLNPLLIEPVGGVAAAFAADPLFKMKVPKQLKQELDKHPELIKSLPSFVQKAIKRDDGKCEFIIDPECLAHYHYKKDDWQGLAYPMTTAILDDITMLEKMKLADMSALDGAISNIRLWRLGDLEYKILPNASAIERLRDILASNVGGGVLDLVWGPEIDFKESNTQIYKFLGDEKYRPVLNSIWGGLGIPPTLTGLAGQSGGYTNNFISLKTLIERLEYGRDMLMSFWEEEIKYVQKAMGFSAPAELHFDNMILADETSEKNLLIQLADRNIISDETLRERFNELNDIEVTRVNKEAKKRDRGALPPEADPFHNGNTDFEYKKISLQKGEIGIDDLTDLPRKKEFVAQEKEKAKPKEKAAPPQNPNIPPKKNGRPEFQGDTKPRKKRAEQPRRKPSKSIYPWSIQAQEKISQTVNPAILNHYGKDNLRALSKEQLYELEEIKFVILCNTEPFSDVSQEKIIEIMKKNPKCSKEQKSEKDAVFAGFLDDFGRSPNIDEVRQMNVLAYSSQYFN